MSRAVVDPTEVRIWKIGSGDSGAISGAEYEPFIPHFADFLSHIRSQLGAPDECFGRRYQREAVNSGALEIVSPLSGRPTRTTESFVALGRTFYRFCETEEFFVAAARVKFGYPLIALFVPGANLLVRWDIENDKRGIEPKHLAALRDILVAQEGQPLADSGPQPVTILLGHKNFAHHLWNELPALERLLADMRGRIPELLVMREPLGPLEALFPEIAAWKITRLCGRSPSTANGKGKLLVNLGSYCVTSSIRRRIVAHARGSASSKARKLDEEIRTTNAPAFWISVRAQGPKPTNQREALTELGIRLLRDFPACTVLFDGFSLPEDWKQSDDDDIRFYRTAAHSSKKEIDATIADIAGRLAPSQSQQFINLGGWSILDCIAIAPLSTCYFCHIGTVQHKIGWTTEVPGMIHASRRIISLKAAVWYAPSRLENGVMPEAIPANMVGGGGKEADYEILDPVGVAETVCQFFRRCTSESKK
jgi:hypothetical protein